MAGKAPPLVIPIELDGAKALAMLKQLGATGQQTTSTLTSGAQGASAQFASLTSTLMGVSSGLEIAQKAWQAVAAVFEAINEQARLGHEWIKKQVEGFNDLREAMRQIAALKGEPSSTKQTLDELKLAEKGRVLTGQDWTELQSTFQKYGSAYVTTPNAEGSVAQATVDEILPTLGGQAKTRGMSQTVAARIFATVIQKMPKGSKP
jgi:hypothetical protein